MRFLVILVVLSMGLPVACNTCGFGSGPNLDYEMIGQELSNVEVEPFHQTSSVQLRFMIMYTPETLSAVDLKQFTVKYGAAYACSPSPQFFVNSVDRISITSNSDLYEFEDGEELISLFKRVKYTDTEPLEFPIQLEVYEYLELTMVGPLPDVSEQTFVIQSFTDDSKVFKSQLLVSFQ